MQQHNVVHGFKLNLKDGHGKPSIFRVPVLPDQIVSVDDRAPSGATITLRFHDGQDPITWDVVESKQEIEDLQKHCRYLDKLDANVPHYAGLKGGKRIG